MIIYGSHARRLLAALVLIASCDSSDPGNGNDQEFEILLDSHELRGPGHEVQATLRTPVASGISWSSSNPDIVSVDQSGRLTGEDFGTATIEAASEVGFDQITVEVVNPLPDESSEPVIAFVNVHVVPMSTETVIRNQTVVVSNGVIVAIGRASATTVPDGAVTIAAEEGQDWYLAPGLSDMHVHTGEAPDQHVDNDMVVYLANGVTTVREMWGTGSSLRQKSRNDIDALGPTVYAASPGMDGPSGPWASFTPPIETVEAASATVAAHVAEGYDYIKVYDGISREVYDAVIEEAAIQGIRVVGHVPVSVPYPDALEAGQYSLEHQLGYQTVALSGSITSGSIDPEAAATWATNTALAGAFSTPTLTVGALTTSRILDIKRSPEYDLLSPNMRNSFETGSYQGIANPAQAADVERNKDAMTLAQYQGGVPILLGSDAGFGYMIPGVSIHDELANLVEAGLTPYDAIAAGTTNAADFFNAETEFGTVEVGRRADLILVFGNPLDDVARLDRRLGVMVRGRWLSEPRLRDLLDDIRTSYGN